MKFGYLVLREISKFVATGCQIMKSKNAPNAISAGAALQTPMRGLKRSPRLSWGLLLRKERERTENGRGEESGRGKWRKAEGKR